MAQDRDDEVIVEGDGSSTAGAGIDGQSAREMIAGGFRMANSADGGGGQPSPEQGQPAGSDPAASDEAESDQGSGRGDASGPPGRYIRVNGFEVDLAGDLAEYSRELVQACPADGLAGNNREAVGFITDPDLGPFFPTLDSLVRQPIKGCVAPLGYGFFPLPGNVRDSLVVITERPPGLPLSNPLVTSQFIDTPEAIVPRLIQPIVRILAAFQAAGLTHRRINPDNVFLPEGDGPCVLGECWMGPPGRDNDIRFETYDCAMAEPDARGSGAIDNDLFALGCLVYFAATGKRPGEGLSDEAYLDVRVAEGTRRAFLEDESVPKPLLDLISGLLRDLPEARWSMVQVLEWIQGRRAGGSTSSPANSVRVDPISFMGQAISSPRHLSLVLGKNWTAATTFICTGAVNRWIRTLPQNEMLLVQADRALAPVERDATTASDAVLSTFLAVLDPQAPIRYRDLSVTISGIPPMLLRVKGDSKRSEKLLAAISSSAPRVSLEMRKVCSRWEMNLGVRLSSELGAVRPANLRAATEKLAYSLNPGQHCLSPVLGGRVVRSLGELIPALEGRAKEGAVNGMFIDFEMIAFIVANDPTKEISRYLRNIGAKIPSFEASLDFFRLLAALQRSGATRAPALARATLNYAMPAIWQVRSRKQRKTDIQFLERAADKGVFDGIVDLLSQRRATPTDLMGFRRARSRYSKLVKQSALIRLNMANVRIVGEEATGNFTMFLSAIISSLLLLFFFLG